MVLYPTYILLLGGFQESRRLDFFWDKFGYPDYMLTKYGGRFEDILYHWWFDSEKDRTLQNAMKNDQSLPLGDVEHTFWKDL